MDKYDRVIELCDELYDKREAERISKIKNEKCIKAIESFNLYKSLSNMEIIDPRYTFMLPKYYNGIFSEFMCATCSLSMMYCGCSTNTRCHECWHPMRYHD